MHTYYTEDDSSKNFSHIPLASSRNLYCTVVDRAPRSKEEGNNDHNTKFWKE